MWSVWQNMRRGKQGKTQGKYNDKSINERLKCEWGKEYIGRDLKNMPFAIDIPQTKYHRNIKIKKIEKH